MCGFDFPSAPIPLHASTPTCVEATIIFHATQACSRGRQLSAACGICLSSSAHFSHCGLVLKALPHLRKHCQYIYCTNTKRPSAPLRMKTMHMHAGASLRILVRVVRIVQLCPPLPRHQMNRARLSEDDIERMKGREKG